VYLCERSLGGSRGLLGEVFVELERDDAVADVIPTPGRRRLLAREDVRPACLAVEVGAEEERARGAGGAFGPRPLRGILPRASANLNEANRREQSHREAPNRGPGEPADINLDMRESIFSGVVD